MHRSGPARAGDGAPVAGRARDRLLRRASPALVALAALTLAALVAVPSARAHTTSDPLHGGQGSGLSVIGHSDLGGAGLNAHLEVHGDHAYVGMGKNGAFAAQWNKRATCDGTRPNTIKVVNLADPANPRVVSTIPLDSTAPGATVARSLSVIRVQNLSATNVFTGDLLAVALEPCAGSTGGRLGFELWDVSNPASPRYLGSNNRVVGTATRDVSLVQRPGGQVLALEAYHSGGIGAFDVSNPTVPVAFGTYSNDAFPTQHGCRPFAYAQGVSPNTTGSKAYAAYSDNGLLELDLSGAAPGATLPVTGSLQYPTSEEGNSLRFVPNPAETLALATDEDPNPARTTLTISSGPGASMSEPGGAPGVFKGCEAIWGAPLYEKANPSLGEREIVFVPNGGCPADYSGLNVTGKIVLVDRVGSGDCFNFDGKGRIASGMGAAALLIANTSSGQLFFAPDAAQTVDAGVTIPVILMRKEAGDAIKAGITAGAKTGTLADSAETWGALRVIDLTGANPVQSAVFNAPHTTTLTPGRGLYHADSAVWDGDRALVAWMSDGLRVVDLRNPASPQPGPFYVPPAVPDPSGNYPTVPLVIGADRHGPNIVISDINGGLYVLGDPVPPVPAAPAPPALAPLAGGCSRARGNLIRGTATANSLIGTAGADRIFAGAGNDSAEGRGAGDCIALGAGSDTGRGGSGNDRVEGEGGRDRLFGDAGHDRVYGGDDADRVEGGSGSDRLRGDAGTDLVVGGSGHDRILGGSGRDRIFGNSGRDRIRGGTSGDRISGGSSGDRIWGDSGNDLISGYSANDRISGGSGHDRLRGGSGRDRIAGHSGNDRISGGTGNDRIHGGSGNDRLNGRAGHDRITGSSGRDRIWGSSGNDRIHSRDGRRDRINCGSGRDTVRADRHDIVARNCERVVRR